MSFIRVRILPLLALPFLFLGGCSLELNQRDVLDWQPVQEPPPDQVETVLFIGGDAGAARFGDAPVLHVQAMRGRGERMVIVAGHHPFVSGGPHGGGLTPVWKTLGIKFFLARSGALLQALNSIPLRELRTQMVDVFTRTTEPFMYAGGHEHSLQVFEHSGKGLPRYGVISGTLSKLTNVGYADGQKFRSSIPGYVRVFVLRDSSVIVSIIGFEEKFLHCEEPDPAARTRCIAAGMASAKEIYSARLR